MTSNDDGDTELLYPFYLDTDMTMAFSAALTGGVALETESVAQSGYEEEAARKLRLGLRLFDLLDVGGGGQKSRKSSAKSESRIVRRHTEASIFITLFKELRRRGMIVEPSLPSLAPGQIVSMEVGPATAPLLRVVDQILRLLDITSPEAPEEPRPINQRPPGAKQHPGSGRTTPAAGVIQSPKASDDAGEMAVREIRKLFRSLKGDLEYSGMTDIVVRREGALSVLLTLDNRFITDQALELLHTSTFRVIGKVTQIWREDTDFINLYRRSVLSLVTTLPGVMGYLVLGMLGGITKAIDVAGVQQSVSAVLGIEAPEAVSSGEITIGDDFQAMIPGMPGPAIQILPLAVCA